MFDGQKAILFFVGLFFFSGFVYSAEIEMRAPVSFCEGTLCCNEEPSSLSMAIRFKGDADPFVEIDISSIYSETLTLGDVSKDLLRRFGDCILDKQKEAFDRLSKITFSCGSWGEMPAKTIVCRIRPLFGEVKMHLEIPQTLLMTIFERVIGGAVECEGAFFQAYEKEGAKKIVSAVLKSKVWLLAAVTKMNEGATARAADIGPEVNLARRAKRLGKLGKKIKRLTDEVEQLRRLLEGVPERNESAADSWW